MKIRLFLALLLTFATLPCRAVPADWTTPIAPFKISGNLYYVGSRDLAAYLITTPKGNILINANLESSPAQIRHSVEQLGLRWTDTKILLSSQAHYDHAAGAAEVLRETHAQHMVMDGDVEVIQSGGATDFDPTIQRFPPARVDRTLHDLDTVTLGGTTITAHKTPGHTRGCTAWTMQTHENGRTLNVVIVGGWGLNPGVPLIPSHGRPAAYPGITTDFDHTFATLKALPCDIFLGAHGAYFDLLAKLDRLPKEGPAIWIDPNGYHKAVLEHEATYHKELAQQQSNK
ncbi:subclass B3 metallo-beta-lactamase [Granulicella sp. dw_53]|uniref:subclass B3 metallo-beta-lactamase n=1 Tax=Granulicella sp. dw_53 TaxID=2719792 RepID=UPI001BD66C36|nr:subclass B3 metallo-beta-lactamase [Granulicella sp. dw_53]